MYDIYPVYKNEPCNFCTEQQKDLFLYAERLDSTEKFLLNSGTKNFDETMQVVFRILYITVI